MTVKSYFVNLWHAMLGGQPVCADGSNIEHFNSEEFGIGGFIVSGLSLLFVIIYSYGAARLSWYYNVHNGDAGSASLWSVICFLFPSFYYPYYSISLNPLNSEGAPAAKGGRSRR